MAHQYVKAIPWRKNNIILDATRRLASGQAVSSSSTSDEIIIPKRIPRGKTDILKALSSTVGLDPTAAHYKYIDDPYLIPNNRHQKLVYALSKESGRKAAKFFLNKFPELFIRDEAEPKVEAFHFKELFDDSMDLNEEDIKSAIQNNQVDNAITAFKSLKAKEGTITDDTTKDLLELVCFLNSLEAPDPDLREKFVSERNPDSIWVSDFAFEVFDSLSKKDGKAYSIMIAGLCKHSANERALQLYNAAKEGNLSLTIEGYNALIFAATRGQSFDNRWSLIMEIVSEMNKNKIAPNLLTFASIFDVLSRCKITGEVREKARGLMAEMKRCNIEPSLSIYNDLLRIFSNGNNARPRILEEILDEIEGKELTKRHERDDLFFSTAMAICNNVLSDLQLAYRLHSLASSHKNYLLLGPTDFEYRYYNHLFKLIVKGEKIDNTMETYYRYVPNIYVPDTSTFIELLEAIELYQADRYIPQICSDFLLFEYYFAAAAAVKLLQILSRRVYAKDIQDHVNNTVSEIMRFIESRASQRNAAELANFEVALFDNSLKILSQSKDLIKARKVLELLRQLKKSINGQPSFATMREYVDTTIELGSMKDLIEVVKTACVYEDGSVLGKAIYACKKKNLPTAVMDRLEDIRSKYRIIVQDYSEESSDSSDGSSESSDDETHNQIKVDHDNKDK